MARVNLDAEPMQGGTLIAAGVAQMDALLKKHIDKIMQYKDESEDQSLAVNFKMEIDCSTSEPQVKVGIRYSQAVTDSRVAALDDPNQGTFRLLVEETQPEQSELGEGDIVDPPTEEEVTPADGAYRADQAAAAPKRRGRRKAAAEAEPVTT